MVFKFLFIFCFWCWFTSHHLMHRWFPRVFAKRFNVLLQRATSGRRLLLLSSNDHVFSFVIRPIYVFTTSHHLILLLGVHVLLFLFISTLSCHSCYCRYLIFDIFEHLLLVVGRYHRMRLLVNVHVIRLELLSKGVLDDAAHAFKLTSERFQFSTARRNCLLQNRYKNVIKDWK